jgi:hypothetical protein
LESGDLFVVEANEYHLHGARAGGTARVFQVKASGYFHDVGLAEDYLMQPGGWSPEQKKLHQYQFLSGFALNCVEIANCL